jgi:hypothetical protein
MGVIDDTVSQYYQILTGFRRGTPGLGLRCLAVDWAVGHSRFHSF